MGHTPEKKLSLYHSAVSIKRAKRFRFYLSKGTYREYMSDEYIIVFAYVPEKLKYPLFPSLLYSSLGKHAFCRITK